MDSASMTGQQKPAKDEDVPLTRFQRKKQRILGEASGMKSAFFGGFMVGGAVGGIFGSLTGCYLAYQYKQISLIPLLALSSGCTFGFFMGINALIRTNPNMAPRDRSEDSTYQLKEFNAVDGTFTARPMYTMTYGMYSSESPLAHKLRQE